VACRVLRPATDIQAREEPYVPPSMVMITSANVLSGYSDARPLRKLMRGEHLRVGAAVARRTSTRQGSVEADLWEHFCWLSMCRFCCKRIWTCRMRFKTLSTRRLPYLVRAAASCSQGRGRSASVVIADNLNTRTPPGVLISARAAIVELKEHLSLVSAPASASAALYRMALALCPTDSYISSSTLRE
jgi:hypothetical protein